MSPPELSSGTGSPICDTILRGVVGVLEQAFPDRVRGYFLRGSYASATPTAGSDLDMVIVFKDSFAEPAEVERARSICESCALLCPVLLEVLVVSERQLRREENLVIAWQVKLASRPVYGQDIRSQLPDLHVDRYVRAVVHTPYASYAYPAQRRSSPVLTYPLRHIDPEGPFYGFDQWLIPGPGGEEEPSTKLLVATVCWTATALIALRTGRYVRDKRACVELYQRHIRDPWTLLVVSVHELCRNQWQYRVPTADDDRRRLRELCDRALAFQNHFLGRYRTYLLDELQSATPHRQILAAQRLGQICYPDGDVIAALHELRTAHNPDLRQAVKATLDHYPASANPASADPASADPASADPAS